MKFSILTTAMMLSATLHVSALAKLPQTAQSTKPVPMAQTSQPVPSNPSAKPTQTSSSTKPAQPDSLILNVQLQQAVCAQDWKRAINVVDRMIGVVNRQRESSLMMKPQLIAYRGQLQGLLNSRSVLPTTAVTGCTIAGTTSPNPQPVASPAR
jgi:hypothetical protein